MAADVTTKLIQMVESAATPGQSAALAAGRAALGATGDVVSSVADWVQILGTVVGPVAQQSVAKTLGEIAQEQADGKLAAGAAAEAAAVEGAAAAGAGAALVLVAAAILAIVGAAEGGDSGQSQQLLAIRNAIQEVANEIGSTWWPENLNALNAYWAPPSGGIGLDLDDLARQGTGGSYVRGDARNWHTHAQAFANALTSDLNSTNYWQAPPEPVGDLPQAAIVPNAPWWHDDARMWQTSSWYGHFPTRPQMAGSPGGNVVDPATALPILALALQSYLALQSLANLVDSSQPPLDAFLSQYGSDFTGSNGYLRFLYEQYSVAVRGIVKTDLPAQDEILGALWALAYFGGAPARPNIDPTRDPSESWGAPHRGPRDSPVAFSGDGFHWTGLYGAAATYPQYGYYGRAATTATRWPPDDPGEESLFTPAYIVSTPDQTNAIAEWWQTGILFEFDSDTYVNMERLYNWVIPWLENKVILGSMARWKAIYLLNRYDGVWAVLQSLELMLKPDPPIVPAKLELDDGTRADGDWSLGELLANVRTSRELLAGIEFDPKSVTSLAKLLYNIANGTWGGPPPYLPGGGPQGPFSLRDLLARVAG